MAEERAARYRRRRKNSRPAVIGTITTLNAPCTNELLLLLDQEAEATSVVDSRTKSVARTGQLSRSELPAGAICNRGGVVVSNLTSAKSLLLPEFVRERLSHKRMESVKDPSR